MTRRHMMQSHGLFLLLYLMGLCWGTSAGVRNQSCSTGKSCVPMDPAEDFLQCVGLPSTDTGAQHLHRLHNIMEALMDLYTFMHASVRGVPVLSLAGELDLNLNGDPLQNQDLVHMWLEVKMKPLLHSMSQQMLSCLSSKNFSCDTYQLMVREMSENIFSMDTTQQKWIYDFFMFPFLSREGVQGCVEPGQNSVDWLLKNFGDFRAMARIKDFSTLCMEFSGLEVLDLLSPAQKAELLLTPGVAGLDNGTLLLVFNSLMGHTNTSSPGPPYGPHPTTIVPPGHTFIQMWDGFMTVFRPISGFVHEFVTYTSEVDVATIRATDLLQLVVNYTLEELAEVYGTDVSVPEGPPDFDPTSAEDWYMQVVMPVLVTFLPEDVITEASSLSMAFHELYYLEYGMNASMSELQDVCSLTLDQAQCGLTDVVEDLAYVLHCAAETHFTLSENNVLGLMFGLAQRLTSLLAELAHTDLQALAADVTQIFTGSTSTAVTQQHLTDPDFIQTWFQIKLLPLLPDVSPQLLTCLSRKNFSCPVYQTIVKDLSEHMVGASPEYQHRIYEHFIYAYLWHHKPCDGAQCPFDSSAEWIRMNFDFFSQFARITDFYRLNPHFSGVEALPVLSPRQTVELMLLPLHSPPEQMEIVDEVFDFLLTAPDTHFMEVMDDLVQMAPEMNVSCDLYTHIFVRLYGSAPSVSPALEPHVWATIEDLIAIAPEHCVPENITCPVTNYNGTDLCGHWTGSLCSVSNMSMDSLCDYSLETYACAQLENFTANHLATLLTCDLPHNTSHSQMLWKLLLTKLSSILDPALDILAAWPTQHVSSSAMEILDVLGEIRVSFLTDEELRDPSVVQLWFSIRLRPFLPHASGRFLRCLSHRNISCSSFQHILQIFSQSFNNMTDKQQHVILKNYILRFLTHEVSGPGCVSLNSSQWLIQNLGPFSALVSLEQLLQLNPDFNPLDALPLLTPEQSVELLLLNLPIDKETLINMLFNLYTEETELLQLLEALQHVVPQANLSCSDYKTLFNRLDQALVSPSPQVEYSILATKMALSLHIPPGCVIYQGECSVTVVNETQICAGVDSSSLQFLIDLQLPVDWCNYTVEQLACASLSNLTAQDLVDILTCNRSVHSSGSRASWKLLLSKVPHALELALDLLEDMTLDHTQAALPLILNAIREIQLDVFPFDQINHPLVIYDWLRKLQPFLFSVDADFLHCLATKALNCSTFQHIVQVLSMEQPNMSLQTQMYVYTHFIKVFLTRNTTSDPSCSALSNSSITWVQSNLGAFSAIVPFPDLMTLYPDFSPMEALSILSVRQLAELSAYPGMLQTADAVDMVMGHVPNGDFTAFFDVFSSMIRGHESQLPPEVMSAMLQQVFDRANLSDPSTPDAEVTDWLQHRLPPLLHGMSPAHVAPFFDIINGRSCEVQALGMSQLNSVISTLDEETKESISLHIIDNLEESFRCYQDSQNLYSFLEETFQGFPFPDIFTIMSLIPRDQLHQVINSMSVSELGALLRKPGVTVGDSVPCELFDVYEDTPGLLESGLPEHIRESVLRCVWRRVLMASSPSKVDRWFNALLNYLDYLTRDMLSPNVTHNASCLAFRKLVEVMGYYDFTGKDFDRPYIFNTIRSYLASEPTPRCYDPSDPELSSTAWFADYIGDFFSFMTVEVLQTFGSDEELMAFTVNPENIALLNHSLHSLNFTNYYTMLVYMQDPNFNPLLLPVLCRCVAPGQAFTQLTRYQSMVVLSNLSTTCITVHPQIAAALAGNFGHNITVLVIEALGQENTGMSVGQIMIIPPHVLVGAIGTLSEVQGWSWDQAYLISGSLLTDGGMEFNSETLLTMGTLVMGLPSFAIINADGSELQDAFQDAGFVQNLQSAPGITQELCVEQLISSFNSSQDILEYVPPVLAYLIYRTYLLTIITTTPTALQTINTMRLTHEQAVLIFPDVANKAAVAVLNGTDNLSSSVLQGFSCSGVRTFPWEHVVSLVKACRRTQDNKVQLKETQLTCMYFYIRNASDATDFSLYPADVLLYYSYNDLVTASTCRSYFTELGRADFSVISEDLSYIKEQLFSHAKTCLGISGTSLSADQVSVLGNMCCILNASYILDSDPLILEKLQNCPDLTEEQANAVETVLESENTPYGNISQWDLQTLEDLGTLTLYLHSSFYHHFDTTTLENFYGFSQTDNPGNQLVLMLEEVSESIQSRSRRRRDISCTVGEINHVTISGVTFPSEYLEGSQMSACLSPDTVKENLASLTEKVKIKEHLRVVLDKLNEAYNGQDISESHVRMLGRTSRVATSQDIIRWPVTVKDTLNALMNSTDGQWDDLSLARQIINQYLSTAGNSLGTAELGSIGGTYLCTLDNEPLKGIRGQSLRDVITLDVSSCSLEQKRILFNSAVQTNSRRRRSTTVSLSSYQLIEPYMGGATESYVTSLVTSDVNMNMPTFISLDPSIIQKLTVSDVAGLLGTNTYLLKAYENNPVVRGWITEQYQSDLDTLNIGLTGGKPDPTSAPGVTTTTGAVNTTAVVSTAAPTVASNTTAAPTVASSTTAAPTVASNTTAAPTVASNTTAAPTVASNTTVATTGAANTTANTGAANTTANTGAANTTANTGVPTVPTAATTVITTNTTTNSTGSASPTAKPSSASCGLCLLLLFLFSNYQHIFT